jgi:hypothetical protein
MEDINDDLECRICCEKKIEDKLDCNHPICLDCCKNLSDLLCPFCKQELKGPMITDEIVSIIKTKNELEKTKKEFHNFCTSYFFSRNFYNPELLSDFYTNDFIHLLDIPFDKWKKYITAYSFFVKDSIALIQPIADLKLPNSGFPDDIIDDIKEPLYNFNKSIISINNKIKEKNKIIMAEGHSRFIEAYYNGFIEESDVQNEYYEVPNPLNRLFDLLINYRNIDEENEENIENQDDDDSEEMDSE